MTIEVSLSPRAEKFLQGKVESGDFESIAQVVEEAVSLFEDYDQLRMQRIASLRKRIEEGRKNSTLIPAEEAFDELRRRLGVTQA